MATLTPSFRDFLPAWIARQPWYSGAGVPATRPVGFYRLEDPAGSVGLETHLLTDGSAVYQIPMSYRGAPLRELAGDSRADPATALITEAEHSELGTRWIYDAVRDPVWVAAITGLVEGEGRAATRSNDAVGPTAVRGVRCRPWPAGAEPAIELNRVLVAGPRPDGPHVLGAVMGSWHAAGADGPATAGCMGVLRRSVAAAPPPGSEG
jgi:Maltokinase N-terminal cap domain